MKKNIIFLLIILFTNLLSCSLQNNFQTGINDFNNQDYRQAFIHLKPEAKKGNADAQYSIGYMYYYGQGVVQNKNKALYWINRTRDSGQKDAINASNILK